MTINFDDTPKVTDLSCLTPKPKVRAGTKRNLFGSSSNNMNQTDAGQRLKRRKIEKVRKKIAKFAEIKDVFNDDLETVGRVVCINGKEFPIINMAEGKYHKVYGFTGSANVEINDQVMDPEEIVLKCFNQQNDPVGLIRVKADDIKAYKHLKKEKVPQPKAYIKPYKFTDVKNPKYGDFWINQKMEKLAPIDEKFVLKFVRKWITKSAEEKREIIADFFPRNVMVREGECYIVDPTLPDEDDDWKDNLFEVIIAWSNKSQETYDFLTKDLPKTIKKDFMGRLWTRKLANDGNFPETSQTCL